MAGAPSCAACSDVTTCTAFVCDLKFSDDPSLASTDGWNVLSESCMLGSGTNNGIPVSISYPIKSGQTLKVKKDTLVSDPVVIDRQATISNPGKHFSVEGKLEMEGVTLTGGFTVSFFFVSSFFSVLVHMLCEIFGVGGWCGIFV